MISHSSSDYNWHFRLRQSQFDFVKLLKKKILAYIGFRLDWLRNTSSQIGRKVAHRIVPISCMNSTRPHIIWQLKRRRNTSSIGSSGTVILIWWTGYIFQWIAFKFFLLLRVKPFSFSSDIIYEWYTALIQVFPQDELKFSCCHSHLSIDCEAGIWAGLPRAHARTHWTSTTSGSVESLTTGCKARGEMKSFRVKLANAGTMASTLCAIECAITPFLLMALPLITGGAQWHAGLEPSEPAHFLEWVMIGFVGLFAFSGVAFTFPSHKQWKPVVILAIGFCILLFSRLGPLDHSYIETVITFVGTGVMIWAGMLNRRLIQHCTCHSHHSA